MSSQTSQTSLFSNPTSQGEKPLSVSALNNKIKTSLEGNFGRVWLKGEISNFKAHSSGHYYFSLKDQGAQISGVMFRGQNLKLKFRPKDGMEVLVRGRVTVYAPRGNYQLLCEKMEPIGTGGLQEEFELLKNKLRSEGLFDQSYKKRLPFLPFKIALVTSPTGAAVQDMIQVLGRRHPSAEITVVPTLTQGAKAAASIIEALTDAENLEGVEVVILSRGGGSLEDMWCFNDESLARKIFSMKTPVISGVGHEIDFTISDFVADLRAPTPSAAAELVCKNIEEIKERIIQSKRRLYLKLVDSIKFKSLHLSQVSKRLIDPRRKLEDIRYKVDDLILRAEKSVLFKINHQQEKAERLSLSLQKVLNGIAPRRTKLKDLKSRLETGHNRLLEKKTAEVEKINSTLTALSPYQVLDRGYSIIKDLKSGEIVKDKNQVKKGARLSVRVSVGEFNAEVLN